MIDDTYYSDISITPKQERPRELLFEHGPEYLSDQQLIAIIIGSGTKGNNVMRLSKKVLNVYLKNPIEVLRPEVFCEIDGMGQAKAAQLSAAMEFARRRITTNTKKLTSPADVVPILFSYTTCKKEHFICISLNGAHEVIAVRVVSIGTLNKTLVHPREVFSAPLTDSAAGIICAHNHPSGTTEPSHDDIRLTERIQKAGEILGIRLLDHLIISVSGYYSFLENGLL
ncbi:MAG: DNA repair protein RadC [Spirochaetales bacterium]|nr:DNA repair protein RadC [Spirochaetales bacterium]